MTSLPRLLEATNKARCRHLPRRPRVASLEHDPRGASAPRMVEIPVVAGRIVGALVGIVLDGQVAIPRRSRREGRLAARDRPRRAMTAAVVDPTGAGAGGEGAERGGPGGRASDPDRRSPPRSRTWSLSPRSIAPEPGRHRPHHRSCRSPRHAPSPPPPPPPDLILPRPNLRGVGIPPGAAPTRPTPTLVGSPDANTSSSSPTPGNRLLGAAGGGFPSRDYARRSPPSLPPRAPPPPPPPATATAGGCSETLRSISFGARHGMVFLSRGPVYLVALASAGSPRGRFGASCAFSTRSFSRRSPTRSSAPCAARRVSTRANSSGARTPRSGPSRTRSPGTPPFLGAWAPAPVFAQQRRRRRPTACPSRHRGASRRRRGRAPRCWRRRTTSSPSSRPRDARDGRGGTVRDGSGLVLLGRALRRNPSRNPENFAPVCLPRFRSSAFAHAYVAYLEPEVVLVLVATRSSDRSSPYARRPGSDPQAGKGVLGRAEGTRRRSRAGWGWGRREPRGTSRGPGDDTNPRRTRLVKRRHSRRVARGTWAGASVDPGRCASRPRVPEAAGGGPRVGGAPSLSLHETAAGTIRRPGMGRAAGRSRAAQSDSFARTRASSNVRAPADGEWADTGARGTGAGGGAATGRGFRGSVRGVWRRSGRFSRRLVRGGVLAALGGTSRAAQPPRRRVHYEATDERVLLGCSGVGLRGLRGVGPDDRRVHSRGCV